LKVRFLRGAPNHLSPPPSRLSLQFLGPKYAGQNVANPIASILARSMMLDCLGETRAARGWEGEVEALLRSKRIPSLGTDSGFSTPRSRT